LQELQRGPPVWRRDDPIPKLAQRIGPWREVEDDAHVGTAMRLLTKNSRLFPVCCEHHIAERNRWPPPKSEMSHATVNRALLRFCANN
jgi:hypothetical protein